MLTLCGIMKTLYNIAVILVQFYLINKIRATFFEKITEVKKNLKEFQKLKLSAIECTIKCNIIENCEVSGFVNEYCILYETDNSQELKNEYSANTFIEKMKLDEHVSNFDRDYEPRMGYLIDTIKLLKKNWLLSMDINPLGDDTSVHRNIIHFTINGEGGAHGDRTPALFFPAHSNFLHIASSINNNANYYYEYDLSQAFRTFTKVNIKQEIIKNVCYYTIRINNTIVHQVVNSAAQEFSNVKVYLSDPWHRASKSIIRNLLYYTW